jgi:threonine dehydrogenase-like Zn-dependent dehydrogenase
MRAAIFNGPGDIGVEERPRPEIEAPTDAIVRVTHTAVCGSDLWFYRGDSDRDEGSPVGREPMGIVEAVGDEVDEGYRMMDEREAVKVLVKP